MLRRVSSPSLWKGVVFAVAMAAVGACGVAAKRVGLMKSDASGASEDATFSEDGAALSSDTRTVAYSDAADVSLLDSDFERSQTDVFDSSPFKGDTDGATISCPPHSLDAGDYTRTLTLDGGSRTYGVHVPAGLMQSTPAPLVFAFHGGGQTATGFEGFVHLQSKSDSSGFILVEPEGTPALPGTSPGTLDVWNAGNCCELAAQVNDNVDDVGFVVAMLASIEAEICVDPKRVFATGFSNGAMLSHRLACELSDRIASIAAVSGGMGNRNLDVTPVQTLFPCSPQRAVPVLHIHGTEDACYPFDGGYVPLSAITAEPVAVTIGDWVTRNGCSSGAPTTVLTTGAATCLSYPCPTTGNVELCMIDGGGHYWPGGDDWAGSEAVCGLNQGVRSTDLIANDALWTWFVQHPMP
jgi:polyhydroxybutyrate depolymerase